MKTSAMTNTSVEMVRRLAQSSSRRPAARSCNVAAMRAMMIVLVLRSRGVRQASRGDGGGAPPPASRAHGSSRSRSIARASRRARTSPARSSIEGLQLPRQGRRVGTCSCSATTTTRAADPEGQRRARRSRQDFGFMGAVGQQVQVRRQELVLVRPSRRHSTSPRARRRHRRRRGEGRCVRTATRSEQRDRSAKCRGQGRRASRRSLDSARSLLQRVASQLTAADAAARAAADQRLLQRDPLTSQAAAWSAATRSPRSRCRAATRVSIGIGSHDSTRRDGRDEAIARRDRRPAAARAARVRSRETAHARSLAGEHARTCRRGSRSGSSRAHVPRSPSFIVAKHSTAATGQLSLVQRARIAANDRRSPASRTPFVAPLEARARRRGTSEPSVRDGTGSRPARSACGRAPPHAATHEEQRSHCHGSTGERRKMPDACTHSVDDDEGNAPGTQHAQRA